MRERRKQCARGGVCVSEETLWGEKAGRRCGRLWEAVDAGRARGMGCEMRHAGRPLRAREGVVEQIVFTFSTLVVAPIQVL